MKVEISAEQDKVVVSVEKEEEVKEESSKEGGPQYLTEEMPVDRE